MALASGRRFGPYEIVAALGAGGMGEVYRARDTQLKRDVALKVLPAPLATDADRLSRFQREAELLAALNHPHIAHIYGLADADGVPALVMELVDGATLAERIARGAVPVGEALPIAQQLAEALEYAHERGIIHRDLKPANIKVTPDGVVKVLDFGLAKALAPDAAAAAHDLEAANSPTITTPLMTEAGIILGTAAYMSPEQARGAPVDKRADIWAFGVVLFEMLTARHCFGGHTTTDVLAAVVKADPDWSALPPETQPPVRRLLARCLTKDRKQRLHDIADARLEIEETTSRSAGIDSAGANGHQDWRRRSALPLAGLAGALTMVTGWMLFRSVVPVSAPDVYAMIPTAAPISDPTGQYRHFDISRDGRLLAYSQGAVGIVMRPLASLTTTVLLGTEHAIYPTFSPSGEQLAFYKGGRLFRSSVSGGAQTEIARIQVSGSVYWGEDDQLYFASGVGTEGIWRVSARGGAPESVTTVRDADRENAHRWPELLPGGKAILYTALGPSGGATDSRVVAQRLGSDAHEVLEEHAIYGRYLPSGHLLFAKDDGTLYAVRFDASALKTTGQAVAIQDGIGTTTWGGAAFVVFSATGTEAYLPRSDRPGYDFLFTDRQGRSTTSAVGPDVLRRIGPGSSLGRLSPSGMQIAMSGRNPGSSDVWIVSSEGAEPQRLTLDVAEDEFPIWSLKGDRVAYTSADTGVSRRIFTQDVRGGGKPTLVKTWPRHVHTSSWSPDGRWLAVNDYSATHGMDIWAVSLDGKESFGVATAATDERDGAFSPDGHWLAYGSGETGRSEVFVVSFPSLDIRRQVTSSGGSTPRWDGSGHLYYLSSGSIVAQSVDLARGVPAGPRSVLFPSNATSFDVTRDGQRFLLQVPNPRLDHPPLYVRTNWFDDIRAKIK